MSDAAPASTPPSGPTGKTRHGEMTLDQIADIQPGLARLMAEISDAYWYAFYAAKGGNFDLARYYVRKTANLFRVGNVTRPKYAKMVNQFMADILDPLEAAANAKDWAAFEPVYRKGIEETNRYHVLTGHPEIVWKLPDEAPRHLDLGPQAPRPPKEKKA